MKNTKIALVGTDRIYKNFPQMYHCNPSYKHQLNHRHRRRRRRHHPLLPHLPPPPPPPGAPPAQKGKKQEEKKFYAFFITTIMKFFKLEDVFFLCFINFVQIFSLFQIKWKQKSLLPWIVLLWRRKSSIQGLIPFLT